MILEGLDLAALGLDAADIRDVTILRERPTHVVRRLFCRQGTFVLKSFTGADPPVELVAYDLLRRLGVPTLPVHGRSPSAILLEDLHASNTWRRAVEADQDDPACGAAVAAWYRRLHDAGARFLAVTPRANWPFRPWVDSIAAPSLSLAAERLGLTNAPALSLALETLDTLLAAYRRQPPTLNYQDFAIENLALSRDETVRQAVVYDYDNFTIGTRASDWRNVMSGLNGAAGGAFARAYGRIDPAEALLDAPLAVLEGLIVAAGRPRLPGWARPLIAAVGADPETTGSLAAAIQAALAIC